MPRKRKTEDIRYYIDMEEIMNRFELTDGRVPLKKKDIRCEFPKIHHSTIAKILESLLEKGFIKQGDGSLTNWGAAYYFNKEEMEQIDREFSKKINEPFLIMATRTKSEKSRNRDIIESLETQYTKGEEIRYDLLGPLTLRKINRGNKFLDWWRKNSEYIDFFWVTYILHYGYLNPVWGLSLGLSLEDLRRILSPNTPLPIVKELLDIFLKQWDDPPWDYKWAIEFREKWVREYKNMRV